MSLINVKQFLLLLTACISVAPSFGQYVNNSISVPGLYARIARNLVHQANFAAVGTISLIQGVEGYPIVNLVPVSDGELKGRSTVYVYFYQSNSSLVVNAIKARNNVSALLTPNGNMNCDDPAKIPTCYSVMIIGCAISLRSGTNEYALGLRAFMSRHPETLSALAENDFILYKLVVEQVLVLDSFGRPYSVTLRDYFTYN